MSLDKDVILLNAIGKLNPGGRSTTSIKFKSDLVDFFIDKNLDSILEVGTWGGHTTRILSFLFKKVITIDKPEDFDRRIIGPGDTAAMINKDRNNITYVPLDIYRNIWNFDNFDAIFVDAVHCYAECTMDINNSLKFLTPGSYLIFDDFSNPHDSYGVRRAINTFIDNGFLMADVFIGEEDTDKFFTHSPEALQLSSTPEGIICKII